MMPTHSRDRWNGTRYRPGDGGGHYESWFQGANDASGRRAFWIRYTIFSLRRRPADAVGELWAIAFDRETRRIVAVKEVRPISACSFASDRLDVRIGEARLDDGALRGGAAANGHAIAWDLRYAWGQVAGFDEQPDAFLECLTARLRVGPLWTPWMSPVVLRLQGETLGWNGLPRAVRARGRYEPSARRSRCARRGRRSRSSTTVRRPASSRRSSEVCSVLDESGCLPATACSRSRPHRRVTRERSTSRRNVRFRVGRPRVGGITLADCST